eukprot:TRINITY_DN5599_c1_g2_i2.p1 TRINITY_DN5599_c1_g2~~TRINITY_DN5599_c1_g2_i2.p1  ORF type:complete len:118 (+),score=6.44 TRINITY_DN5599_c1_g2_i2:76-429(+)
MRTCSKQVVLTRDDEAKIVLLVRNTFYELRENTPVLARTKSEPAMQRHKNADAKSESHDADDEDDDSNESAMTSVIVRDLPCKVGCETSRLRWPLHSSEVSREGQQGRLLLQGLWLR